MDKYFALQVVSKDKTANQNNANLAVYGFSLDVRTWALAQIGQQI